MRYELENVSWEDTTGLHAETENRLVLVAPDDDEGETLVEEEQIGLVVGGGDAYYLSLVLNIAELERAIEYVKRDHHRGD